MKRFTAVAAALFAAATLYAQSVTVSDAYVREVPPNMPNSAAFMTLTNATAEAVDLVSAESDAAATVELHEHANVNGMMQMRQIHKITVPANGTALLKPGGLHVMLIGLTRKLKEGENVTVTLNFSNGEKVTLDAPVKKVMAGMMKSGKCGKSSKEGGMKCGSGKCGK